MFSEPYPAGLGATDSTVLPIAHLPQVFEKLEFSFARNKTMTETIEPHRTDGRNQIVMSGIETQLRRMCASHKRRWI